MDKEIKDLFDWRMGIEPKPKVSKNPLFDVLH
jgi:hypothetical protein